MTQKNKIKNLKKFKKKNIFVNFIYHRTNVIRLDDNFYYTYTKKKKLALIICTSI